MIFGRRLLCACLLTSLVLPVTGAFAQEGASKDDEAYELIKPLRLSHSESNAVVAAIKTLELPVLVAAAGPNMIVLRGSPADVQKAAQMVTTYLDLPGTTGVSEQSTAFISVGIENTADLVDLVHAVVHTPWARVALDEVNRMLVVRASEEDIAAVRRLIEEIDRPRESLTAHFYFIRATIGGKSATGEVNLPPALQPVAKTLTDNGFGNPSLMAPITVVAHGSREFDSDSTLRLDGDLDAENQLNFSVRGVARLEPDGETVQLTVDAGMYGQYGDEDEGGPYDTNFSVDTTIAMKLDSYVILAASPSSTAGGNAVALVVRVTKQPAAGAARE